MIRTCQYANCLEDIGPDGVMISLKTPDSYGDSKAGYCCATHASAALTRLAMDRGESIVEVPRQWKSA